MTLLDDLSPSYVGEDRLDVRLDASQETVRALQPTLFTVDYSRALPEGVMLPLVLEVQGPSAGSYQRRIYTRVPKSVVVTFREGGAHLVILKEVAHNRWHGKLRVQVEGDALERPGD